MTYLFPGNCKFSLFLSAELHQKASILTMIMRQNGTYPSKTVSRLYDMALYEYFKHNRDDIVQMIDEYYHTTGRGEQFMEEIGL